MAKQEDFIRHLERNIICVRYLFEVYKITYEVNSQAIANNKALASLLANTYLRSLILSLCTIYSQPRDEITTRNLSLEKSFKNTFTTTANQRPDLKKLIDDSVAALKACNLDKIRNKKIAHIDMEEVVPTLKSSDPATYRELVNNAELIIAAILEASDMKAEREPPNPKMDPALLQLKSIFTS